MKGRLGDKDLYVGQGLHTHRQATGKWASPFREGQHGTRDECLILYGDHLRKSDLLNDVRELRGLNLWCDCPYSVPCVADLLIAAVYEDWQDNPANQVGARPGAQAPKPGQRGWAGKALSALVATSGDVGRAAALAMTQLVRYPPLSSGAKMAAIISNPGIRRVLPRWILQRLHAPLHRRHRKPPHLPGVR